MLYTNGWERGGGEKRKKCQLLVSVASLSFPAPPPPHPPTPLSLSPSGCGSHSVNYFRHNVPVSKQLTTPTYNTCTAVDAKFAVSLGGFRMYRSSGVFGCYAVRFQRTALADTDQKERKGKKNPLLRQEP